ncbi:hypothetical protein COBT_003585 [Conglomerata obtusa]
MDDECVQLISEKCYHRSHVSRIKKTSSKKMVSTAYEKKLLQKDGFKSKKPGFLPLKQPKNKTVFTNTNDQTLVNVPVQDVLAYTKSIASLHTAVISSKKNDKTTFCFTFINN